jgi:hypothetical protein
MVLGALGHVARAGHSRFDVVGTLTSAGRAADCDFLLVRPEDDPFGTRNRPARGSTSPRRPDRGIPG